MPADEIKETVKRTQKETADILQEMIDQKKTITAEEIKKVQKHFKESAA